MKEDKKSSEAINSLYYHGILRLSLEGGKPPRAIK